MKKFYLNFILLLCVGAFAQQQAGKAGELLKNEVKANEKNVQQSRPGNSTQAGTTRGTKSNASKNQNQGRRNNNDYRWNNNYGNSEVFLRIPENGYFTVEIGDQMISNATGKFRFFDLSGGTIPISIYEDNFLIYRTRLVLRNNTRTVLDFFSDYGLYLLGNYPQQNQAYGFNEWDDVWNNPYNSQQGNWNGNNNNQNYYGNVMSNQEFNNLMQTVKRDTSFDNERSKMIASIAQYTNFNAMQVHALVKSLSFDNNKVQLAKQLFSKCVDKQNYHQVYAALSFDSSKRELSNFISNN